jgi:predicted thioesterase
MQEGLEGTVELTVAEADTARSIGSGDVDVLATPRIVALCERAAVAALSGALDENQTTVGTRVVLDHTAPTVVGGVATATARLEHLDGKTLSFALEVSDEAGVVARGTHTRVIVDRERFVRNAHDRR